MRRRAARARCALKGENTGHTGGVPINRDFRGDNRQRELRVNERIRAREVRVIDEDGQVVGVMSSAEALRIARERNVDLVEVSPMANPPVCRLMDYGRFKYEQAKKENEARKRQKTSELKEIRLSPKTDEHDVAVKVRKVEEFLGEGDKVKVVVRFRGREMAHPELGRRLLEQMMTDVKNIAVIERPPIMEGRMMSMILTKAPNWEPVKRATPAPRARKQQDGAQADEQPAPEDAVEEAVEAVDAVEAAEAAESAATASPTPTPEESAENAAASES
ncbi:MAG TPA: translation initiation factor IF-3 [Ktedonobacterales bacterium]